jgi:hypothetical protein
MTPSEMAHSIQEIGTLTRDRFSSDSYRGGPGSIRFEVTWDLWYAKWLLCPTLVNHPLQRYIISMLTASLNNHPVLAFRGFLSTIGQLRYGHLNCVGLAVLTALTANNIMFLDVTPCRPVEVFQRFGGTVFTSSFDVEDLGVMFLRNVGELPDYVAS